MLCVLSCALADAAQAALDAAGMDGYLAFVAPSASGPVLVVVRGRYDRGLAFALWTRDDLQDRALGARLGAQAVGMLRVSSP